MEEDWDDDYRECTEYGPILQLVEAGGKDWPQGVVYLGGRMYRDGILLVPEGLVGKVVRELHSLLGHPGGPRLWEGLKRKYHFPNEKNFRKTDEYCKKTV